MSTRIERILRTGSELIKRQWQMDIQPDRDSQENARQRFTGDQSGAKHGPSLNGFFQLLLRSDIFW